MGDFYSISYGLRVCTKGKERERGKFVVWREGSFCFNLRKKAKS
jgi:hypothetical protein